MSQAQVLLTEKAGLFTHAAHNEISQLFEREAKKIFISDVKMFYINKEIMSVLGMLNLL